MLPATAPSALVVADTATELALGQARQMPNGRPPGVEALPDVFDVVADHANLLGPGTEEALARELSRVWINQKIEVFLRTVDRDAITGYELNALKIIRGRSGHCLVLVFTDTPATYLYVFSDSLSQALGLDGVRRSVQNAFEIANTKRPADARIIATVVALLQQIVTEGGITSAPQQTTVNASPAPAQTSAPTQAPETIADADPPSDPKPLPSAAEMESPSLAPSRLPSQPDSDSALPEASAAPAESVSPAPETSSQNIPEPEETSEPRLTKATETRSTLQDSTPASPASAPPRQLLLAGGVAVVLLLALFTFQKLRARARGKRLSLNAPPPSRASRAEHRPLEFKGTLKRGLPQKKPVVRQQPSPTEVVDSSPQPTQPLEAAEKAFPHTVRQSSAGEPRFETIRIRKDYSAPPPSTPQIPTSIVAEQVEHPSVGTADPVEDMPSVAEPEKSTPTRTPLLRKMGMEPDQHDAKSGEAAKQMIHAQTPSPQDAPAATNHSEALLQRIEAYVISMRRAAPAQRLEMLRGLEILLLAYREAVGEPHPAEKQLEMEMKS